MNVAANAQTPPAFRPLNLGDMVVTRFSGKLSVDRKNTAAPPSSVADRLFLDPEGISAHVVSVARPGYIWDARLWPQAGIFTVAAAKVGQVFGVTLDDADPPNAYLAASSFYGLPIVASDPAFPADLLRLRAGAANATFMPALFGAGGSPGSIWRLDGRTGAVTLFADLKLDGQANHGPALGNVTYDPASRQIFASDLSTGMIHRIALDGRDLGHFDHGKDGRVAAGLPAVAFDPAGRADIHQPAFRPEDVSTWGMAQSERRVHGVSVHRGRLYYAVHAKTEIWSVGLTQEGGFASDARFEVALPQAAKALAGSDIVFTSAGQMVVAQRGETMPSYVFDTFAEAGTARVYRFRLKVPQDPPSPGLWFPEPGEYAVGFAGEGRNTTGGLDLGYGYDRKGQINLRACEASLWATGENLRNDPKLREPLERGGPLVVSGVQGMPSVPVKTDNMPPWASYMVDVLERALPDPYPGEMGDVAVYRKPCGAQLTAGWYSPQPFTTLYGGPGGGYPYPVDYSWETWTPPPGCVIPGLCPPPPPQACLAVVSAEPVCDEQTGEWVLPLSIGAKGAFSQITATTGTSGMSITGGPTFPLAPQMALWLKGLTPGKVFSVDLCGFDGAAKASGKPYDCCKATVLAVSPSSICEKK